MRQLGAVVTHVVRRIILPSLFGILFSSLAGGVNGAYSIISVLALFLYLTFGYGAIHFVLAFRKGASDLELLFSALIAVALVSVIYVLINGYFSAYTSPTGEVTNGLNLEAGIVERLLGTVAYIVFCVALFLGSSELVYRVFSKIGSTLTASRQR